MRIFRHTLCCPGSVRDDELENEKPGPAFVDEELVVWLVDLEGPAPPPPPPVLLPVLKLNKLLLSVC